MNSITAEYTIPAHRLPRVQAVLDTLNKRCRRLKLAEITLDIVGTETREIERNNVKQEVIFNTVQLTGSRPKLGGWEFAATFEHDPETKLTIIRSNDTFTVPIPLEYRKVSAVCDHCKLDRRRNDTFLCYNADQQVFKQIGRNCLRDFLGHADPHAVLAAAECWFALCDACGADDDSDPDAGWREFGAKTPVVLPLEEFVVRAFAVTRTKGFIGRAKARELDGSVQATADLLLDLLLPAPSQREKQWWKTLNAETQPNERDEQDGKAALVWARSFEARLDSLSDYLHNLFVGCASDFLPLRRVGIVASLAAAYLKHIERERAAKQASESRLNEYFGTVGERLRGLVLKVENIYANQSDFGTTYITRFSDKEGRTFVWFASGVELEKDKSYKVTGTVKKHEDYQKQGSTLPPLKQTILSRCKCDEVFEGYENDEQHGLLIVCGAEVIRPISRESVTFPKRAQAVKFAKKYADEFNFLKVSLQIEKLELVVVHLPLNAGLAKASGVLASTTKACLFKASNGRGFDVLYNDGALTPGIPTFAEGIKELERFGAATVWQEQEKPAGGAPRALATV